PVHDREPGAVLAPPRRPHRPARRLRVAGALIRHPPSPQAPARRSAGPAPPPAAARHRRPPNRRLCTSMAAWRSGVRMARAVALSGAPTSAAVPGQVAPSAQSSGPYDQLVPVARHGEVGGPPRSEAEHEEPVAPGRAAGKVPPGE